MDVKGLAAGLDAAIEAVEGEIETDGGSPLGRAVQLPLIPTDGGAAELAEVKRGAGRPKGAMNRASRDWRDYILARYPSPLVFLAETYSRSTEQLAAELRCNRDEAFEIQRKAAADLAPYIHRKQPLEIAAADGQLMVLNINTAPAPPPPQAEQNQGVIRLIDGELDNGELDKAGQALDPPAIPADGGDNEK